KMEKEGYFDQQYKKEIPAFPGNIAIITSPTGAAIRDIISTLKRRFPIVQLKVIHVMVQGEKALNSILTAISKVNNMHTFDRILSVVVEDQLKIYGLLMMKGWQKLSFTQTFLL